MQENSSRENHISPTLILLDGISGTGKTMLMRVLDALEDTSPPCFDYSLEQLVIMGSQGRIQSDDLKTLISLHIDQLFYDQSISREINLRFSDLSSVLRSTKRLSYLRKLFLSDEKIAFNSILVDKGSVTIVVHQLLNTTTSLDQIYRGQLKRVLCVRHPYYLFEHWRKCVEYFGTNPRDFTLTLGPFSVPWFIDSDARYFSRLSNEDKAAECIAALVRRQEELILSTPNLYTIDFEKFVLTPDKYLSGIEKYCGKKLGNIEKILKKENVPRHHINSTRSLDIYRKYNAHRLKTDKNHEEDYYHLKSFIKGQVKTVTFDRLEEIADLYETRFGLWFD